uniref:Uncharacterized protein n=1 Tax=Manihot esculenta TaxID=3983 RepID=A0A2C9V669_MANES
MIFVIICVSLAIYFGFMCAFFLVSTKFMFVVLCVFGPRLFRVVVLFCCVLFSFSFFLGQTMDKSKLSIFP